MGLKKLQRFKEICSFKNVFQYPENSKGKWHEHFQNYNPIILELACGKGEYTVELAKLYPDKNFIGVDVKGNRMWVGAKKSLDQKIHNAAFLRTQIDKIDSYFNKDEISEIWITFPDPHLRKSKARKRLTHPKFLRMYKNFLQPNGPIHLKTDSPHLYRFTKTIIELYNFNIISDVNDLYKQEVLTEELKIKTYYESLDIANSKTVFYLCFSLPETISESDETLHVLLKEEVSDEDGK